jgi:hypothetical protein
VEFQTVSILKDLSIAHYTPMESAASSNVIDDGNEGVATPLHTQLEAKIKRLRNCEHQLEHDPRPGMRTLKTITMAEISKLNRKLYSK